MNKQHYFKALGKRLATVGMAVVMLFVVFISVGCTYWETDYEWNDDSFSLELSIDRCYARIGDEVILTATFRNLSGRNLLITVLSRPRQPNFEDAIAFWPAVRITTHIPTLQAIRLSSNAIVTMSYVMTVDKWSASFNEELEMYEIIYFSTVDFYVGITNQKDYLLWPNKNLVSFIAHATPLKLY